MYNHKTDKIEELGYIDKEYVLSKATQEEIFSLVFGFQPKEFDYVTSPFRPDTSPGCWFEYFNEELRFKDFGNSSRYGKINLKNIDCFDAVQVYNNLPNFYEALRFIKSNLIDDTSYIPPVKAGSSLLVTPVLYRRNHMKLFVCTRAWDKRDKVYWSKYQITSDNLIEDRVFPIIKLKSKGNKKGDFSIRIPEIAYVYTDFEDSRKKIYRPYQSKRYKFITNCINDDIGDIARLTPSGRQLVISKSYKDCRVLRNQGLNSVWFQNEGQMPNDKKLKKLCERFDRVLVFFDNDDTGIKASKIVSDKINSLFTQTKSTFLYLPEDLKRYRVTDPADLIYRRGLKPLQDFLKEKKLI